MWTVPLKKRGLPRQIACFFRRIGEDIDEALGFRQEAIGMRGYERFFEGISAIFEQIRATQGEAIEQAAALIAEAILQDGVVHIFGTGHSNTIGEEVFGRANTLAPVSHVMDLSLAGSVN
ncbi:MAG: DUF2529 family protein, partial [Saprospiraceae bacterium]|nr:DUF2529 family protein [Saprospiraceae bacterium]